MSLFGFSVWWFSHEGACANRAVRVKTGARQLCRPRRWRLPSSSSCWRCPRPKWNIEIWGRQEGECKNVSKRLDSMLIVGERESSIRPEVPISCTVPLHWCRWFGWQFQCRYDGTRWILFSLKNVNRYTEDLFPSIKRRDKWISALKYEIDLLNWQLATEEWLEGVSHLFICCSFDRVPFRCGAIHFIIRRL